MSDPAATLRNIDARAAANRAPESIERIRKRLLGKKWGRPTTYRGVEFRSYLESRFAWFLDEQGETWRYEPRRIGGYLPDFQITSAARQTFVEVKPTRPEVDAAQTKMAVIWDTIPDALLIVACAESCAFFAALSGQQWVEWRDRWRYE